MYKLYDYITQQPIHINLNYVVYATLNKEHGQYDVYLTNGHYLRIDFNDFMKVKRGLELWQPWLYFYYQSEHSLYY